MKAELYPQFIKLRGEGYSIPDASKKIGIGVATGKRWDKKLQDKVQKAIENTDKRAIDKYIFSIEDEILKHGKILDILEKQTKTNFFMFKSDKDLIELYFKTLEKISEKTAIFKKNDTELSQKQEIKKVDFETFCINN